MALKPPYTSEWGKMGHFKVWLVDADQVRKRNVEFTNFEQHYHDRAIPRGEVWIDDAVSPHEIPFLARMAVTEASLMGNGATYAKAEGVASKIDSALRKSDPANHARVRLTKLGDNGKIAVWLVKGEAVRGLFDDEYTLGGHWLKYPWIPKGEIWMDDATRADDRPYDFLHELDEVNHMLIEHWPYEKAHHTASAVELTARNHPQSYVMLLNREQRRAGGDFGLEGIAEFRALMSRR